MSIQQVITILTLILISVIYDVAGERKKAGTCGFIAMVTAGWEVVERLWSLM